MKQTVEEFKKFIMKGNVLDLAVAVMVGGAFNKIVTSLTADIMTPFINLLVGDYNKAFVDLAFYGIRYGAFLQTVLDFLITALIIFFLLKTIHKLGEIATKRVKKQIEDEKSDKPAEPTEVELLKEIRNLLKKQSR